VDYAAAGPWLREVNLATGAVLRQISSNGTNTPAGVAFDPAANEVHVLSDNPKAIYTYSAGPTLALLRTTTLNGIGSGLTYTGLDRDPATGELLLTQTSSDRFYRLD